MALRLECIPIAFTEKGVDGKAQLVGVKAMVSTCQGRASSLQQGGGLWLYQN